jgi:hypothetical protein
MTRSGTEHHGKKHPTREETPQLNTEIGDDDPSPDPSDVQMMALLAEFVG